VRISALIRQRVPTYYWTAPEARRFTTGSQLQCTGRSRWTTWRNADSTPEQDPFREQPMILSFERDLSEPKAGGVNPHGHDLVYPCSVICGIEAVPIEHSDCLLRSHSKCRQPARGGARND
jgi:hypothetical protein